MNDRVFQHTHAHKLRRSGTIEVAASGGGTVAAASAPRDACVADVGAGTGYFSIPIAQAVGDAGTGVGRSICSRKCWSLLRQKLEQPDAPKNISLHLGSASQLPLPDDSVNVAFYANIWHELDDEDAALREGCSGDGAEGRHRAYWIGGATRNRLPDHRRNTAFPLKPL